jgi:hypothetical protein
MMVKRFLIFVSVVLVLVIGASVAPDRPVQAQGPFQEFTWEELGLGQKLRMEGFVVRKEIAIPAPAGLQPVEMRARLRVPPSVAEGYLEIRSRDQLLALIPFDATKDGRRITIPFEQARLEGNTLPLTFIIRMRGADDFCTGLYKGGWIELNQPTVQFSGEWTPPRTVGTFFPRVLHQVFLVTPSEPTLNEAQTALILAGALKRNYRHIEGFQVTLLPLNIDGSPPDPVVENVLFTRMIVIREGGENRVRVRKPEPEAIPVMDVTGEGERLMQEGLWLSSQWDLTAQAQEVSELQFVSVQEIGRDQVLLSYLNPPTWELSGMGKMEIPIQFSQGDLGGPVRDLGVHVAFRLTPLQSDAQATFAILFNDALIYASSITNGLLQEQNIINIYAEVPRNLIQRDNTLVLQFVYTPAGGRCSINAHPFMASLDPGSYLAVRYGADDPVQFLHFPQVLIPEFQVAFSELTFSQLDAAVAIVGEWQRLTRTPISPIVVPWEEAMSRGARDEALLLITTRPEDLKAMDAPVLLEPFRVLGPDGREILQFTTETPFGVGQSLAYKGKRVFVLASQPPLPPEEVAQAIVHLPNGWYDMRGDAFIYSSEGDFALLKVQEGGVEIEPLEQTAMSWFQRWQGVLYPLLLLVALGVGAWLYPRLVRSRPAPTAAEDTAPSSEDEGS